MKKIGLTIFILLILALIGSLFIFPRKLNVNSSLYYNANAHGVFSFLTDTNNWAKWWPGNFNAIQKNKGLEFRKNQYDISKILYHAFELNVISNQKIYPAHIKVISASVDSTVLEFTTEMESGFDPFSRISNYFRAKEIKSDFHEILNALGKYTSVLKNIYGFDIHNEKVQMQHLVSTSKEFDHFPTTGDTYLLIEKLRKYISTTDAKEEFYPMLNIETTDSIKYTARVGLPVNKLTTGTKDITPKQMVKNGNILVTEVTGGLKTLENARKQMERYIIDYQRSIIAIPFQSLQTDRLKVTDTSKWITKIYYPVV